MDNNALLMLAGGAKKIKGTIGVAGEQGFGVGVYPGSKSDLTAMGLSPMQGCEDPTHANYGNYQHTNGSIMVFVPAFCYRIGNTAAPSYSRDKENALEIRDAALGEGGGWVLHRAFIDGGVQKLGFFMDKYICSKDSTGKLAISVKNGDNIMLYDNGDGISKTMPDCSGRLSDAITLSRARGANYSLVTCFQWSAISMLSLAHGQAASSTQFCGWYDGSFVKNYPKGSNRSLSDVDDPEVHWASHSNNSRLGKTGSGTPFEKTTHNGQPCGITEVNGSQMQPVLGFQFNRNGVYKIFKDSVRARDITKDNVEQDAFYETGNYSTPGGDNHFWGASAFNASESGTSRALCGVIPNVIQNSRSDLFGADKCSLYYGCTVMLVSGNYGYVVYGRDAGIWSRYGSGVSWSNYNDFYGFRAAGYAK